MISLPVRFGILAIAISLLGVAAPASLGQNRAPETVDPNEGFNSPDGEAGLLDSPTGAFGLIHNSVLRNDTSSEEFRTRQRDRLGEEANNFLNQRQRLIRDAQENDSEAPSEE
ncbi:hypothetical protein C7271_16030 [filamentous cyanobacterium CCP5]|nr:hypothetical protein C7271_16030 [filamentous cyanobacterium CCP5]